MPTTDMRQIQIRSGDSRRLSADLFSVCIVVAASLDSGCSPPSSSQADAQVRGFSTTATDIRRPLPDDPDKFIGIVSCAAAGCHGLIQLPPADWQTGSTSEPAWRTAYWKWKERDPHANAYDTLWLPRSIQIVENLDREKTTDSPRYSEFIERTCCGCHNTGRRDSIENQDASRTEQPALGVHCEACHGAARDWVAPHTFVDWADKSADERRRLGQNPTRDLVGRAQVCVGCHVGSPAVPGSEVNHELIAAGHPRLNFEFTVYLANLPPHWDVDDDREWIERSAPDARPRTRRSYFELEAWQAGQLVTADQVVSQLAERARRSRSNAPAPTESADRWPEFAEYDCFSCHHDLNPAGYRQRRRNPGRRLSWGSWTVSAAGAWFPSTASLREPLQQLRTLLEANRPAPEDVQSICQELHTRIQAVLARFPQMSAGDQLEDWTKQLARVNLPDRGWTEAAQWSLAVTACLHAHRTGVDGSEARAIQFCLERQLLDLQVSLAFNPETDDPLREIGPTRAADVFDSPRAFDPTESDYRRLVRDIRMNLDRLAKNLSRSRKEHR